MDKESSVRSNLIADKVYKSLINTLDNEDNEVETDLYKIKIFGKNVIIAPGKSREVNPKYKFFYVYAIKNEKVVAKLGVYEKEINLLEETPEIYDLTKFKDGSLLLFDVYYNTPDLISDLEELETLEEEEEELEENVSKLNKNVKLEIAEVVIDGNDYVMKNGEVFDLNDKKVGTTMDKNMLTWNNNSKPKSKLQVKDTYYDAFDYLNQAILINKINTLPDEEQSGLVSKLRLLIRDQAINVSLKGKNIAERRKLTNILNEMFTVKNEMLLSNPTFFKNLKKIQKVKSAQNVIKIEEKTVIMLYILENFLDVSFIFKNKDYTDFDISKIINIKFSPNAGSNKQKVIVIISNTIPHAQIAGTKMFGTSLNEELEENVGLAALEDPILQEAENKESENKEPANEEFNEGLNEENEGTKAKPGNVVGQNLVGKNISRQNVPGKNVPGPNYRSNVELSPDNNESSNNNSVKSKTALNTGLSLNTGEGLNTGLSLNNERPKVSLKASVPNATESQVGLSLNETPNSSANNSGTENEESALQSRVGGKLNLKRAKQKIKI
jgi:hypothetical protein